MTSKTPEAGTPVATGIASGSLGTGTAVDDETTLMAVPEIPEATDHPEAADSAPLLAPVQPAAPAVAERPASRRDPYRPIGIALAAVLVALVGLAVLSSGGDAPAQLGAPPVATGAPPASLDAGQGTDEDGGDGDEAKGKCNGRGNDPCDREGGDGD